ETTAASVLLPHAVQQGAQRAARRGAQARIRPYQQRRAPATQTTASLPQVVVTAAQGYQPARGAARQAASSAAAALAPQASSQQAVPSILAVCPQYNSYSKESLSELFDKLFQKVGMVWNKECTSSGGCVSSGAVAASALSFSDEAIQACADPVLKELLLRVNAEGVPERRAYLLVKALRAYNELSTLWPGALTSFCFLLGICYNSVLSWQSSLPSMSTVAPWGAPAGAPLTVRLPVDSLTWPELLRFLQEHVSLQQTPDLVSGQAGAAEQSPFPAVLTVPTVQVGAGAAGPTPRASMAGYSFAQKAIDQCARIPELSDMMRCFNQERDETKRNTLFVRIICVLKGIQTLPPNIVAHLCNSFGVTNMSISSWYLRYNRRATRDGAPSGDAGPLGAVAAPATPSLTPAAVVRSASLAFPVPAATTSAAPSAVQTPAPPVFTAPITSTAPNISAAQLDPTLLPFTQATPPPTLEELLALPIVRDSSMEMDAAEILEGGDFDLDL
ncbi:MAG: hypothetical protein ACRC1U_02270, partial [Vibrionaceae bacterium]